MRLTHDDQMRQAALHLPETCSRSEPVSAPVEITRPMLNRAAAVRPQHLLWRARSAGAMRGLLALERHLK